jgi:hypothetical protein
MDADRAPDADNRDLTGIDPPPYRLFRDVELCGSLRNSQKLFGLTLGHR